MVPEYCDSRERDCIHCTGSQAEKPQHFEHWIPFSLQVKGGVRERNMAGPLERASVYHLSLWFTLI
jgi:hypothetical protein